MLLIGKLKLLIEYSSVYFLFFEFNAEKPIRIEYENLGKNKLVEHQISKFKKKTLKIWIPIQLYNHFI